MRRAVARCLILLARELNRPISIDPCHMVTRHRGSSTQLIEDAPSPDWICSLPRAGGSGRRRVLAGVIQPHSGGGPPWGKRGTESCSRKWPAGARPTGLYTNQRISIPVLQSRPMWGCRLLHSDSPIRYCDIIHIQMPVIFSSTGESVSEAPGTGGRSADSRGIGATDGVSKAPGHLLWRERSAGGERLGKWSTYGRRLSQ